MLEGADPERIIEERATHLNQERTEEVLGKGRHIGVQKLSAVSLSDMKRKAVIKRKKAIRKNRFSIVSIP